jgi:HSP20 family protein
MLDGAPSESGEGAVPVAVQSQQQTQPVRYVPWSPQDPFVDLRTQFARLLGGLPDLVPASQEGFAPAADIEETEDAYILELELPGVSKGDVDVSVSGQVLRITGERKEKERVGIVRRRVRSVGRFSFEVQFAEPLDEGGLSAKLHDGVLTVRVPKREPANPSARRVEVT